MDVNPKVPLSFTDNSLLSSNPSSSLELPSLSSEKAPGIVAITE
jgi:hypothetical protein